MKKFISLVALCCFAFVGCQVKNEVQVPKIEIGPTTSISAEDNPCANCEPKKLDNGEYICVICEENRCTPCFECEYVDGQCVPISQD